MIAKSADDPVNVVLTVAQLGELIDTLNDAVYPFRFFGRDDRTYNDLADRADRLCRVLEGAWREEVDR